MPLAVWHDPTWAKKPDDSPTDEETQAPEPFDNARNKRKPTSDHDSDLEVIMKKAKAEASRANRAMPYPAPAAKGNRQHKVTPSHAEKSEEAPEDAP
ncbi:hypothetical protein JB92DRAFT_3127409 [Gautieria morchelliformis]|nr:hypothetical protein JB92DRAFT_3127409 [Gautieria morchelliformis]